MDHDFCFFSHKDKGRLLDAFYNGTKEENKIANNIESKTQIMKNATYSMKLENIHYVDLRATHFESKSAFINHLIEQDMATHPDIVKMAKTL